MTGEQMLQEIERREYYDRKLEKHVELIDCAWYAIKLGVIICCLLSIAGHVRELWQSLEGSF